MVCWSHTATPPPQHMGVAVGGHTRERVLRAARARLGDCHERAPGIGQLRRVMAFVCRWAREMPDAAGARPIYGALAMCGTATHMAVCVAAEAPLSYGVVALRTAKHRGRFPTHMATAPSSCLAAHHVPRIIARLSVIASAFAARAASELVAATS